MALAQHDAALRDERRRGDAELVRAEQTGDGDVAARLDLAVGLHDDAPAQVVRHEHLLRLGDAELPRQASVLDGRLRRCAGAAGIPADEDDVAVGLGHAGGDGPDADLRDELHVDAGLRVRVLEVVDQLRQVLDGVDVVVRRRRDQLHAGRGVAHPADVVVDLVSGELAALAGLRALGHLDLEVRGVDQVVGRDAEPARGHLLDRAVPPVAVGVRLVAAVVLAALAGVGARADAVHGDGEALMGFGTDGAERDGAGGEALDDDGGRLHLVDGDRLAGLELQQPPERAHALLVLVRQPGEVVVCLGVVRGRGLLELGDGVRVPHVVLAVAAPVVGAAGVELEAGGELRLRVCRAVAAEHVGFDGVGPDAADPRRGPREVAVDELLAEPDRLEDLRAAIAVERGDAHLGDDLEQSLVGGLDVVLPGRLEIE